MGAITVDVRGFRNRVAWRGTKGVLSELVSNAFDEDGVSKVTVSLLAGKGALLFSVIDDSPTGFRNLEEAHTLYAPSYKAGIAEKRGRLNVGEKVAVVLCRSLTIKSTTGALVFNDYGKDVTKRREKTTRGTEITGIIPVKYGSYFDVLEFLETIIPPSDLDYTVLGDVKRHGGLVRPPQRIAVQVGPLPTVTQDEEGHLIKTVRETEVRIYEPLKGQGWVYELGIPVCKIDLPFIVDVRQKVPLPTERNAITPSYFKKLAALVVDGTADKLTEEQARSNGIIAGLANAQSNEAVKKVIELRHGKDRYVPDPNNAEGNNKLFSAGYSPVYGGSYDGATWNRIKQAAAIPSVNELAPRPKSVDCEDYDGPWTPAIKTTISFIKALSWVLLKKECVVSLTKTIRTGLVPAQCGSGNTVFSLTLHVGTLGQGWFSETPLQDERILDLILHEIAHHSGAQDTTRSHANEITRLAAKLAVLLQQDELPEPLQKFAATEVVR